MANTYEIYIRNFNRNGSLVTTEEKMYQIPLASPYNGEEYSIVDPKVKTEMGKAGSFEFTVYPGQRYYDAWNQMKTMLRVVYFGETIFYGRVLTIDFDYLTGKKSIHCEGYLAFLIDAQIEGKPDNDRKETDCITYLKSLMDDYNWWVGDPANGVLPDKRIYLGNVPGQYGSGIVAAQKVTTDDKMRYGSASWQDAASAWSSLTSEFGGYLRTRYENGWVYIDWLNSYFNNGPITKNIEIFENVINMSSSTEVENIFTMLIPVGKKSGSTVKSENGSSDELYLDSKYIYVRDIVDHYDKVALNDGFHTAEDYKNSLNQYGYIYKMVNFANADTTEKLEEYAWDYIKTNYHGGIESFTVSAIDMAITGDSATPVLTGERVHVKYPTGNGNTSTRDLVVLSIEHDIQNPQNDSYTIGIPNIAINKTYGKKSEQNKGGGSGGGGGGSFNWNNNDEDPYVKQQRYFIKQHIYEASDNSEEYQEYKEKYGDKAAASILTTADLIIENAFIDNDKPSKDMVRTFELNAHDRKFTGYTDAIPGSAILNPEFTGLGRSALASIVIDATEKSISFEDTIDVLLDVNTSDEKVTALAKNWKTMTRHPGLKLGYYRDDASQEEKNVAMIQSFVIDHNIKTNNQIDTSSWMTFGLNGGTGAFNGMELNLADGIEKAIDTAKTSVGEVFNKLKTPSLKVNGKSKTLETYIGDALSLVADGSKSTWISKTANFVKNVQSVSTAKKAIEEGIAFLADIGFDGETAKIFTSPDNKNQTTEIDGKKGSYNGMELNLADTVSESDANTSTVDEVANETKPASVTIKGKSKTIETYVGNDTSFYVDGKKAKVVTQDAQFVKNIQTVSQAKKAIEQGDTFLADISLDGKNSKISTSPDNTKNTIEINGADKNGSADTTGSIVIGPDPKVTDEKGNVISGASTTKPWSITINHPITYSSTKGEKTTTYTIPAGSISANDFHISNTFDSLHAKLGVFDQAIIDQLSVNQVVANNATFIGHVSSQSGLSSVSLFGTTVTGGTVRAGSFELMSNSGMASRSLEKLIIQAYKFEEQSDGSMELQGAAMTEIAFKKLAAFKIADTKKYKDGIGIKSVDLDTDYKTSYVDGTTKGLKIKVIAEPNDGADAEKELVADASPVWAEAYKTGWNKGGQTSYVVWSNSTITGSETTLDPGASVTIYARYVNNAGAAGYVPTQGSYDISKKVTARSIKLTTKEITPSTSVQEATPGSDYDGLSKVTVKAAPLTTVTITPSDDEQVETPGTGYVGFSKVTVKAQSGVKKDDVYVDNGSWAHNDSGSIWIPVYPTIGSGDNKEHIGTTGYVYYTAPTWSSYGTTTYSNTGSRTCAVTMYANYTLPSSVSWQQSFQAEPSTIWTNGWDNGSSAAHSHYKVALNGNAEYWYHASKEGDAPTLAFRNKRVLYWYE